MILVLEKKNKFVDDLDFTEYQVDENEVPLDNAKDFDEDDVSGDSHVSVLPQEKSVVIQSSKMKDSLETIFGGSKPTVDSNVHELGLADKNISMKTEINDVFAMTVWQVVGEHAAEKGYVKLARRYARVARLAKVNMVSSGRLGRKEMEHILTARREDELVSPNVGLQEKALGQKRGR